MPSPRASIATEEVGVFWRRKQPSIPRGVIFKAVVVRNPQVKEEDTGEGMKIHTKETMPQPGTFIARILKPKEYTRTYELDALGSFVWKMCDGKRTVAEMADALREFAGMDTREAEVSLIQYLNMLSRRGLVALKYPEEKEQER